MPLTRRPIARRGPGIVLQPNKVAQVAVPTGVVPSPRQEATTYGTDTYTYFTIVGQSPQPLYTGDQEWAKLTLVLETAGSVAVSIRKTVTPVLSGKGILLTTNVPLSLTMPKGSRLYIAATAVNRVKVTVESIAWQEQQLGALVRGFSALASIFGPVSSAMGALTARLTRS